jgi:hypothetical protein
MILITDSKYGPVEYQVYPPRVDADCLTVEVRFIVKSTATGNASEERLLASAVRHMEQLMDERLRMCGGKPRP